MDPKGLEAQMQQSDVVKFRIRPALKSRLREAAADAGTSVSAIVRRAAVAIAEGRVLKPASTADLVAIRSVANELSAAIEATDADPGAIARIRIAAARIHQLAARQLASTR